MRGSSPAPVPAPTAKVVDDVGQKRVGVADTRKRGIPHANSVIERGELRQVVLPVAVLFFETPRAVLQTAAGTDIVTRASGPKAVEKRTIGDATDGVDPEGDGCRVRNPLVRQAGPPALRADIIGHRVGAPYPGELRIGLSAPQRHGKHCASAEQIATFHPFPPAAKLACNDGSTATVAPSLLSTVPMANGFYLNETVCRLNREKDRHCRNLATIFVTEKLYLC